MQKCLQNISVVSKYTGGKIQHNTWQFRVLVVGLVLQLILGWIGVCQAKPLDMPGSLFIQQAPWFVLLQWMASSFVGVSCQSLHLSSLIFNR